MMSATSANKVTSNQLGSADAESDETVVGLGEGVPAARVRPFAALDGPASKLAIGSPNTACLPTSSAPRFWHLGDTDLVSMPYFRDAVFRRRPTRATIPP